MASKGKELIVYKTYREFYPFYLTEHRNPVNRTLHFIGTSIVMMLALYILTTRSWSLIYLIPLVGYGFAWVGHFFFEKNKPATFKYPLFSLRGDFHMWFDIVTGKQSLAPRP